MKLHKKFIDELGLRREAKVGQIIVDLEVVKVQNNTIMDLNDNLDEIEQIFYTIQYLIDNELVSTRMHYIGSYIPDFNPMNFIKDKDKDSYRSSRIHAMPKYLQMYWGYEFLVLPEYHRMIQNGYRTDQEAKEHYQFWLPIIAALVAAIATGLFTKLFDIWLN